MLLIFSIGMGSLILVLLSSGIYVPEKGFSTLTPTSFILMLNTALIEEKILRTEEVDNPLLKRKSLYLPASIGLI